MVVDEPVRVSSEIIVLYFSGFYGGTQVACCGIGGPHNFNVSTLCGSKGMTVCTKPSAFVSWDGIHLTKAAHRHIFKGLLNGPFTSPLLVNSMYVATFLEVNHVMPRTPIEHATHFFGRLMQCHRILPTQFTLSEIWNDPRKPQILGQLKLE